MDPEEIARLCEHLNLDDQDGPVMKMNTSIIEDGKEKMELCLVGLVFGNKIVSREGLGDMVEQVWRTSRKNVPIACRSENCARLWAELIGKVLDVDAESPTLRAWIAINVTVPLCRGLHVSIDNVTEPISIPVQYEYLPEFCFRYGIIGHKPRECLDEVLVDRNGKPLLNRYGQWLKAFNPKQWQKACREQKGGLYWSNSSSSSGKSSSSGGGGGGSDEGYEAVQLLRENQETDFRKSVGGANIGKSLIEFQGLDLEIGLHEGSFHGP
ncbi:Zinc knuckle CX2CX4HX4C [Parasponia andersonii]|uniref:Zinc knuckle CX2CX4HX4C n=1 Tax=Parasponia andersonii TaxID=3476 RepID=A0A2P5BWI9_PARAD|nr:Zinc knuckle CX2CX4HX4C [Parasponia andersonii]